MNKRIFLLAIAPLILLEVSLLIFGTRLSRDISQIEEIQASIKSLIPQSGERTILVVGNSIVGEALDADYLSSEFDFDATVFKAVPDASNIWDWYCVIGNVGRATETIPDIIVVAFAGNRISDQSDLDITRSFGFFCGVQNLPEISDFHSVSLEDKLQVIGVKTSSTYRLRHRIRNGLLNLIIPNYRVTLQRVNAANNSRLARTKSGLAASEPDYTYLAARDLTSREAFRQTQFFFVAMPLRTSYELDASICSEVTSPNSRFIDMRKHVQLGEEDFRDSMHVIASGRKKFTAALAKILSSSFSGDPKTSLESDNCELR